MRQRKQVRARTLNDAWCSECPLFAGRSYIPWIGMSKGLKLFSNLPMTCYLAMRSIADAARAGRLSLQPEMSR
jgi:hypothetical protein